VYLASIIALLLVFPVASVLIEWIAGNADLALLVGKWFVFWAVGARLFIAGVRQVAQPSFTSLTIFGIADTAAEKLVREIGFGNLAMGTVGLASLAWPAWVVPAALAGAIYYGLAGLLHITSGERNGNETIALVSDLGIALLLAVWLAYTAVAGG
jgi:hypothetical protein